MKRFRSLAIGILTVALLVVSLFLTRLDFAAIAEAARQLSLAALSIALMLLITGALLAVVRLSWIAKDIGTPLNFRDAMLALSLGQIAGAISVQFFGQIAARSALLSRRGISSSANIVMATYERAAAVFISAGMAVGGAIYLFGQLSFDVEKGGAQFVTIIAGMLCAVLTGAITVWGRAALPLLRELMTARIAFAMLRNAALTAAIQLCTAGAYLAIGHNLAPSIPVPLLIAAALVVMFAASLPISFSGWGLREISAVFVLGAIGIAAPVALTMALVVGALAFAAVILLAGIAVTSHGQVREQAPLGATPSLDLRHVMNWTLPVATATAVFFQIYLPTGDTNLNVNLADPIAVLGGALFLTGYSRTATWRMPAFPAVAVLWTAVLLLAYAHGYFSFGSNQWALINRLLGWVILLGYLLTGALVVAQAQDKGTSVLARTLAATACGIILFWSVLIFINRMGVHFPAGVFSIPLSGFSQNRNAFSFALLMIVSALPYIEQRHRHGVLAIMAFGLWVAASYAALGTFAVILGLLIWLGVLPWRRLALALVMTGAAVVLIQFLPEWLAHSSDAQGGFPVMNISGLRESSNLERLASIESGLALFLSHPIFGAGLGYFIAGPKNNGLPLVIHSTPVWLLAELGLVGLLAFAVPAAWLYFREFARAKFDRTSQVIVLSLTAFAIMSQAHELMYQRPLWLLLGAALLMKAVGKPA